MKTEEIGVTQQRQHLSQRPCRTLGGAYLGVRSSSARRQLRFDGDRGLGRVFGRGFECGFGLLGGGARNRALSNGWMSGAIGRRPVSARWMTRVASISFCARVSWAAWRMAAMKSKFMVDPCFGKK